MVDARPIAARLTNLTLTVPEEAVDRRHAYCDRYAADQRRQPRRQREV
jgi:hypothetical protein